MICQHTTKSIAYILNTEGISVDVYIDGFYGAESTDSSDLSFQWMNSLLAELGLMDAPEKDSPPSHEMLCLGIWINTLDMTLSVPAFRVEELQLELNAWFTKCSFTKRELQQLLGKLSFVSACVQPGRICKQEIVPCMSLFTCHDTLKYCIVVELLDITSSSNLKKKGDHIN